MGLYLVPSLISNSYPGVAHLMPNLTTISFQIFLILVHIRLHKLDRPSPLDSTLPLPKSLCLGDSHPEKPVVHICPPLLLLLQLVLLTTQVCLQWP